MGKGSTIKEIVALALFIVAFTLSLAAQSGAARAGDTVPEGNRADLGGRFGLVAAWRGEVRIAAF
jgi:hypothetical protein